MKKTLLLLATLFIVSCFPTWESEIEFRNYLRDQYPYCELKPTNLDNYDWTYEVNDTLQNQRFIVKANRGNKHLTTYYEITCK